MNVLLSEPWSYDLIETGPGELDLVVVCGSVGLYEVVMRLTPAEHDAWLAEGAPFVRTVVEDIRNNHPGGRFGERCRPYRRVSTGDGTSSRG